MKKTLMMAILAVVFLFSGVINAADIQQIPAQGAPNNEKFLGIHPKHLLCDACKKGMAAAIGQYVATKPTDCIRVDATFIPECSAMNAEFTWGGVTACAAASVILTYMCVNHMLLDIDVDNVAEQSCKKVGFCG